MITIDQLKAKIAKREAKCKAKQWYATDALFRYYITRYKEGKTFNQTDGTNYRRGYYTYVNGVVTFVAAMQGIEWEVTRDVVLDYKTGGLCTFRGKMNSDYIFVAVNEDESRSYYHVMPADVVTIWLPPNTNRIAVTVSENKDGIFPTSNFTLTLEGEEEDIDVTCCVKNWDELETTQKRDRLSGVMVEETAAIEFVHEAKLLIDELFRKDEFATRAGFKIMRRNAADNNYLLRRSFLLDFASYEADQTSTKLACAGLDIDDYVKAKKSTKYTIPVSEVKGGGFEYKRIELENTASWEIPSNTWFDFPLLENAKINIDGNLYRYWQPLNMSLTATELVGGETKNKLSSTSSMNEDANRTLLICNRTGDYKIRLKLSILFRFHEKIRIVDPYIKIVIGSYVLERPLDQMIESHVYHTYVDIDDTYTLKESDRIEISFIYNNQNQGHARPLPDPGRFVVDGDNAIFDIQWKDKAKEVKIDYFEPEKLLNNLLNRIGSENQFKGVIEWEEDYESAFFAAESIRDIPNANVYTSINDFMDWMKCRGYVHSYSKDTMTFKRRTHYYDRGKVAIELGLHETAGFERKADKDFAYTTVEVGYKKQDYGESINGRFEFNGTLSYVTGLRATSERKLSIISPYRADSVGFEMLCWKRAEKTKDNTSDNDLFEVALNKEYTALYQEPIANVENVELFNAVLSPAHMVASNKDVIGIGTQKLTWTASDSNKDVVFSDGTKLTGNVTIKPSERLFQPMTYEFDAGIEYLIPEGEAMNGVVCFSHRGKTYRGFLYRTKERYQRTQSNSWELYAISEV